MTALETTWSITLLLATCRVVGVVFFAPPMGHATVPVRLRLGLGVLIGLAALGRLAVPVEMPANGAILLAMVAMELLFGVAMGYGLKLLFVGVQLGAEHIGQQIGVGLADAMYPGGVDGSGAVRRLFAVLAIAAFVLIDGPACLMQSVMQTFDAVPLGGATTSVSDAMTLAVRVLGASFLLAIRTAGPVIAAMSLATLVMGILQRTLPGVTVFSVGLPVRVLLGLIVLAGAAMLLPELIEAAWRDGVILLFPSQGGAA